MDAARMRARLGKIIDRRLLPTKQEFIAMQAQQAWLRFVLGIVFTIYIAFHGPYFTQILPILAVAVPAYLALNLYCLYWVRLQPYSPVRLLLMPVVDCLLIMLAMWADGGHMSVVYFMLMSPIVGNGFRYGSRMLRYCQSLALLAMLAISLVTVYHLHLPIDWFGLMAELLGLFYISGYAYSIIRKSEMIFQAKKVAEEAAEHVIAANPHPAFTFDPDAPGFPILFANPAMASLVADDPEKLVGEPAESIVIDEDREDLNEALRAWKPGEMRTCYLRLPGKGADAPLQAKCEISSMRRKGREIGLCYLTDISASERLHHELAKARKLAATAALTAGIAHDFRNLLSGVIGHAELIELDSDDPATRENARLIIEAGERGASMINHLLKLGRSDDDDYRVMEISDSIVQILQVARVQLPPDIKLNVHVSDHLPRVRANIAQLDEVLLNLISNAAQAMPDKRGVIDVELSRCALEQGKEGVRISVRDNGVGIKPENIQHIFKPFWSTRKQSGGTGLGMAMVQRIVRWHQGLIDIESRPGAGTVVTISLPAAEEGNAATATGGEEKPGKAALADAELQAWRILLVEDQPEVLHVYQAYLSAMGHRVTTAVDGRQALDLFREGGFDMVLSDYMMPELDGIELAKAIRRRDKSIPITIITAFSEDQALAEAPSALGIQILPKPLSYQRLAAHIRELQREKAACQ